LSKAAHRGPSACDSEREPTAHSLHLIPDRIVRGAAELQSAGSSLGIDMIQGIQSCLSKERKKDSEVHLHQHQEGSTASDYRKPFLEHVNKGRGN